MNMTVTRVLFLALAMMIQCCKAFMPLFGGCKPNTLLLRMTSDDADANEELDQTTVNIIGTLLRPCCTDVRGTGIGTGLLSLGDSLCRYAREITLLSTL
jgi:hypothetical protein